MARSANGTRGANGVSHAHLGSLAVAGVAYDDPMSKVLGMDSQTSGIAAWFGFTSGSTALLVAFGIFASTVAWMHAHGPQPAAVIPAEIDIVREEPPPPPPPEPIKEEVKPEPVLPSAHVTAPKDAPPPPPAPAQAAKVLTQEPDPNDPVDLTKDTIVQGNADSFAGGLTASNGTNTSAVHALPAATGVPGAAGPVAAPAPPSGPDRSRKASLGGSSQWNAPFPPEADTAQVDDAYVSIQVDVRADGTPAAVRVLMDPGNGFGREARRYAMTKRYASALDHDGNPIPGSLQVKVHFSR